MPFAPCFFNIGSGGKGRADQKKLSLSLLPGGWAVERQDGQESARCRAGIACPLFRPAQHMGVRHARVNPSESSRGLPGPGGRPAGRPGGLPAGPGRARVLAGRWDVQRRDGQSESARGRAGIACPLFRPAQAMGVRHVRVSPSDASITLRVVRSFQQRGCSPVKTL